MDELSSPLNSATQDGRQDFFRMVYGWMALGLLVTAAVGWFTYSDTTLFTYLINNSTIFTCLLLLQIVEVVTFVFLIDKVNAIWAKVLFITYAATVGTTLSSIFYIFQLDSIGSIFVTTAGMFAVLAWWGATTKKDLTSMGSIAMMGLFGLIIASVVNLFLHNSFLDYVLSWIGVLIFSCLTAYDVQKIGAYYQPGESGDQETKEAIHGALKLYLDFINIFLDLLKLFGRRR